MNTYVAMLRGVNVSGHNKIKMEELRALLGSLGYADVVTYVQSGNLVLASYVDDHAKVANTIGQGIADEFGLAVTVLVRSRDELARVVKANPYIGRGGVQPAALHVTFLSDRPSRETLAGVDRPQGPDEFCVVGREVFLHCPNGYGRTKLNNAFFERRFGVLGTTRNWKTVTRLLELADG